MAREDRERPAHRRRAAWSRPVVRRMSAGAAEAPVGKGGPTADGVGLS